MASPSDNSPPRDFTPDILCLYRRRRRSQITAAPIKIPAMQPQAIPIPADVPVERRPDANEVFVSPLAVVPGDVAEVDETPDDAVVPASRIGADEKAQAG